MLMDRKITFDDYRGIIRALRDPEKAAPGIRLRLTKV